jgi:hypothetical protein
MIEHSRAVENATVSPTIEDAGLAARHERNNLATAGAWEPYAEHRARLLALVRQVASGARGGRLCVLGAGNANDLALDELARDFAAIHLVDLDPQALERAARLPAPATKTRLTTHAPVDASGLFALLPAWRERAPSPAEVSRAALAGARGVARTLPGGFDLVVSDCLLTQMYWSCFEALGSGPLLDAVLDGILVAHVELMAALARPGGTCLLVTDAVSSDSVPLEALLAEGRGPALLAALEQQGTLFSGTGPGALRDALARVRGREPTAAPTISPPWSWRVEAGRTVLVYGMAFSAG